MVERCESKRCFETPDVRVEDTGRKLCFDCFDAVRSAVEHELASSLLDDDSDSRQSGLRTFEGP